MRMRSESVGSRWDLQSFQEFFKNLRGMQGVHLSPKVPNLAKVPEMTRILLGPNPSLPRRS